MQRGRHEEDLDATGGCVSRCDGCVRKVWPSVWSGLVWAFALVVWFTCARSAIADSAQEFQPSLAGVVQGPTPWANYNDSEYYDGYLVYGTNRYDCLIYALGLNPNDFDLVARGKLGNPSTGGKFYEVVQEGYNDKCPPWCDVSFYEGWLWQSGVTPGTGTNPQYLWAFDIYDSDYQQAKQDAIAVRDGGDVEGGGSGDSGDGSQISGNNVKFTLMPVYAEYMNAKTPSTFYGYTIDGKREQTIAIDGAGNAPSMKFDITFKNEIDIENPKVYAYITPTRNGGSGYLYVFIGEDLSHEGRVIERSDTPIRPDEPSYTKVNYLKLTRSGRHCSLIYKYSSLSTNNVITNQTLDYFSGTTTTTVTIGDENPPYGYYFTGNFDSTGDQEPSPDPWPDPEPDPDPTPGPIVPKPKDPVTPTPRTTPDPPSTPTPPTPPTPPALGDGGTYTADLSGILEAMNEHCIHIQTCINTNFSNLETFLDELWALYFGDLWGVIYQGDLSIIGSIDDAGIAICNQLADILDYLYNMLDFLDTKLDFQFPKAYNDSTVVYWLKRLYYKKGTGTDSRPVDPVADPFGIGKWLENLANLIIRALESIAPGLVGRLLSVIDLLKGRFPFSLPWDIMAVLGAFVGDPVAPHATIPCYALTSGGLEQVGEYVIDMDVYSEYMEAVRFAGFLAFAVYTMSLLPKWCEDLLKVVGVDA